MMEVYSGARPGRPLLLLTLCGAILAGTLGLAWYQVVAARALGPERAIAGTPLRVRAPRGWVEDRESPGAFLLPVRQTIAGREILRIERRVVFRYEKLPMFRPPEQLLARMNWADRAQSSEPTLARIGPFDGVEVIRRTPTRFGRPRETVVRLACSPRGDVLMIEYAPLADLTYADLELLDDLSRAVRIDDPTLRRSAAEVLAAAGLDFPHPPNQLILGPDIPEVAGAYVGFSDHGAPVWSIVILRSWLALGRRPRDLLRDFAAHIWNVPADQFRPYEGRRPDGAETAHISHPDSAGVDPGFVGARVVSQAQGETALIVTVSSPDRAPAAEASAAKLADGLKFSASPKWSSMPAIEQAGRDLANQAPELMEGRWGREPTRVYYLNTSSSGREAILTERAAIGRSPKRGYQARRVHFYENKQHAERWFINGRADEYTYEWEGFLGAGASPTRVAIREHREPGDVTITRTIQQGGARRNVSFSGGDAFVSPPLEEIAEYSVARSETPCSIIAVSAPSGENVSTLLLQPLAPQAPGTFRVLIQSDYFPVGAIVTYDDAGQMSAYQNSTVHFKRVERAEAEQEFPDFRRLRSFPAVSE